MPSMRAPLVSSFSMVVTRSTSICLMFAAITENQDGDKFEVTISWPAREDEDETVSVGAKLDDKPFTSGAFKEVYSVCTITIILFHGY